ncbi:MAG TPA: hypothetical protein VER55_01000 [Ardenticatenaceae bacterium]|nr:hypothetical protein [Ardenticatenaceae bacterium]
MNHAFIRAGLVALALLAALALPAVTLAGGLFVTLDTTPADVEPGEPFDVGFTVRSMHGDKEPMENLDPAITLASMETGERLTFTATEQGEPGHYVATITLPAEGRWEWSIEPFGVNEPEGVQVMSPIQVGAVDAASAPADAAPATQAATAGVASPAPWLALAGIVVVLALAGLLVTRLQRRPQLQA